MHYRQQQQLNSRSNSGLNGPSSQTDHFMKERERLLNSDRMTQEAIEMGIQTREELAHQRKQYAGMTQRVLGVMSKFPVINSLVNRINWRKKRDSLIMASVISVCSFFILVYWLRSWRMNFYSRRMVILILNYCAIWVHHRYSSIYVWPIGRLARLVVNNWPFSQGVIKFGRTNVHNQNGQVRV